MQCLIPFQLAFNAYQGAKELIKDTCQTTFKFLC